jgi:hypothetical protein
MEHDELEVNWSRAARVWWAFVWRMVVFGTIAGAVVGFPVGAILGATGFSEEQIRAYGQLVGYLVAIPVGIWVVRSVLSREFREFRIVLVPSHEQELEERFGGGAGDE